MTNPVSVVMPVFNSPLVLRAANAVLEQSHRELELVIVDDCSDAEFRSCLQPLERSDERVTVIYGDVNQGAGVARNIGLQRARFSHVAFCDSDDIWFPRKLEIQLAAMLESGAPICCSGYVKRHTVTGKLSSPIYPPALVRHKDLLKSCWISMSTAVVNRDLTGHFSMPSSRSRQDYGLWLQLTQRGHWALGVKEVLMEYSYGAPSVSSNKIRAASEHWLMVKKYSDANWCQRVWLFSNYIFFGLLKYLKR